MVSTPIKPKWTAIEIDETEHLGDQLKDKVKRVWTVYMFDRNSVTRYCSQEKLYLLSPLYVNLEFHEGVPEDERDSIQGDLIGEMGDPDYSSEAQIEHMIASGEAKIKEYGDLGEDENEETVREYWQGNCPL